jgi:hypothetical protein
MQYRPVALFDLCTLCPQMCRSVDGTGGEPAVRWLESDALGSLGWPLPWLAGSGCWHVIIFLLEHMSVL